MANIIKVSTSNVICGTGTYTHTAAGTQMYTVVVRCTEVPTSGITFTLSQSGSASVTATSPTPSPTQNSITFSKTFNCVAGDILTVVITPSTANDNQLNTVKTIVVINQGTSQG